MTRDVKNPGYRVLRCQTYRAMPWRNGRGTTLEIAREPDIGEPFAWRLSLARIERDDDFSPYPGYSRALVLVAGKRLNLSFRGHGQCSLDATRRGARFEGGWQTRCAVPEGCCTDLSLIVHKGAAGRPRAIVRAPTVLRLAPTRQLLPSSSLHGALFVLDGSVAVAGAARAPRTRGHTLRAQDTLLLFPGEERILTLRSLGPSPAQVVLLRWRAGGPNDRG